MDSRSPTVMPCCRRMIERWRLRCFLGQRRQRIFLVSTSTLLLLITITSFLFLLTASTAEASAPLAAKLLDLSYQPHLEASTIVQALGDKFEPREEAGYDAIVVRIDVSNSQLGDDGLRELAQRILVIPAAPAAEDDSNCTTTATSNNITTVVVELKAQMNRLSGLGVAPFLNHLLVQRNNNTNTSATLKTPSPQRTAFIRNLDFGFNKLHHDTNHKSNKALYKALQELLASSACPDTLCLERTCLGPAACRAMAKGIMARFETEATIATTTNTGINTTTPTDISRPQQHRRRLSLYLSGNAIGDSGVAALAAAIRTVCNQRRQENGVSSNENGIFGTLDLSACDIGDAGAEALALALADSDDNHDDDDCSCPPVCRLILSNNRITDQGAISLGRAFRRSSGKLHLVLDNNSKITDQGISSIADAVAKGQLTDVSLCSCSIHADGAELVGKALRKFAQSSSTSTSKITSISIDLSGNPLGILRGKTKSEGSKYSASRIKSKASATASAYMNQGLNFLKKGIGPSTVESDDEEEKKENGPSSKDGDADASRKRCGFKALANAFIGEEESSKTADKKSDSFQSKTIHLGLRRTFCDTAGADALAAMLVAAKDDLGSRVNVQLDLALNPVVEEEAIDALHGGDEDLLRDMAERHTDAMEVIRKAQERSAEARRIMAARREAAAAFDQRWDDDAAEEDVEQYGYDEQPYDDEEWDSDADYENEDEY